MNKLIIILIFISIVTGMKAQSKYAELDNDKGTSMKPILALSDELRQIFEKKLEIVRMEFDIVSNTASMTSRTLYKDIEYVIFAFGDYRIKDLDIKAYILRNDQWILITKDSEVDSSALVKIKPTSTQLYRFEISAYEFNEGYKAAHYGLFVVR